MYYKDRNKLIDFNNQIKALAEDYYNDASMEADSQTEQLVYGFSVTLLKLHKELKTILNEIETTTLKK